MEFLKLRDSRLNNIAIIFQTGFILVSLIILFKKMNKPETIYPSINSTIHVVLGVVFLLLCFYFLGNKPHIYKKDLYVDSFIVVVNSILVLHLITSAPYYEARILFIFPIIYLAIKRSKLVSLSYVVFSSLFIITLNFLQMLPKIGMTVETDLVISGVFYLVAWLIGSFTETEKSIRNELIDLADRDSLTGLYNHRAFFERLDKTLKTNKQAALILLDIDYFKMFNDTWGHQFGDVVLIKISELIKGIVKEQGIVARYGGEEFACILPGYDVKEAKVVAEKIRRSVEEYSFYGAQTLPQKKLTVSIGLGFYPLMAKSKEELVRVTDEALYKAKFVSKNKVEVYYSVFDELGDVLNDSEQSFINSVKTLIMVVNAKDKYTYGHCERVMELATRFAKYLHLSESSAKSLRYGALLHDIGKIEISREILNKHTKLTAQEWETLKTHPIWGADILRPIRTLEPVIEIVQQHHENLDGTGYPFGYKGEDICYEARIMRVIDSYDAMVTNRPYRPGMSHEQALIELRKFAGTHYEGEIVEQFIGMLSLESMQDYIAATK